ncbi:nickel ABC transporter permease [Paenibacillus sp. SYP-B4298]|uniref:nickel ABC transporter permease n=1 Tax=Paenibacillus sp. SYP-B4298 TaxID=2996034 RepID=UPI0022DE0BC3|nr:nickel ABC transporter permease [Paenibacillus sp. SYP-B4298]
MLRQLAAKLVQLVVVLVILSMVTFVLMKLAPGDPVLTMLQIGDGALTLADQQAVREEWGLTLPLYEQYANWLGKMAQLDWGRSMTNNRDVWTLLMERLPATLWLTLGALIVLIAISLPLGLLSAVYKGKAPDVFSRGFALLGASIPSFWLALLLVYLFAYQLNWLPAMGSGGLRYLVLPSVTLGVVMAPEYIRLLRAGLLDTMSQEYIRAAQARGVPSWRILLRYTLRAALIPIIAISGISMGALMAGSVVTESLYGWPGLGSLAIEAIRVRDYPVIQGYVLLSGACFLLANWVSELGLAVLDPRIRLRGQEGGRT